MIISNKCCTFNSNSLNPYPIFNGFVSIFIEIDWLNFGLRLVTLWVCCFQDLYDNSKFEDKINEGCNSVQLLLFH